MPYVVTPYRHFTCHLCRHPAWKWFPKGSDVAHAPETPASFLVGNPVAIPAGPVRLCERHARALAGDTAVDEAVAKESTPE